MTGTRAVRPDPLETLYQGLPDADSYWVAYSGGVDSHVLLHLLAQHRDRLPGPLGAVHIDHQLHGNSAAWARHCQAISAQFALPFVRLTVNAGPVRGESPEATARRARYRAWHDWLPANAVLMLAQHRDDQAETLLLQLLRGAGPRGLAGMPPLVDFANGYLARPLLAISRARILAYARQHELRWVEDPTNAESHFDRNFLRHDILPALRERWPGLSATLARAARHQSEQMQLADALAEHDLLACSARLANGLTVDRLLTLPRARQGNLIRYWIRRQGLPVPGENILHRILDECLPCRPDANPRVHWPGCEIRRYRETLLAMPPLSRVEQALAGHWLAGEDMYIESLDGVLGCDMQPGSGLHPRLLQAALEIRVRRGGERVRPSARGQRHALKKLLQEKGIPSWERERLPLLYYQGELAAVPGVCVCEGFQAEAGQAGCVPQWSRIQPYLA